MARATLKEVADQAGVNVSTASRALSHDKNHMVSQATRSRVLEAATDLDYRGNQQASSLRKGRTGTIGVIVADISNPFIGPALRGITEGLSGRQLLPIMSETRDVSDDLGQIANLLLAQRVDGIICAAGRYEDRDTLKRVAAETPTVLAIRQWPSSGITSVSHDDAEGGRLAAEHLLALGHTRLAQLLGPQDIGSFKQRTRGFNEAAAAAGVECIMIDDSIQLPTLDAGSGLMENLLSKTRSNPVTGIFAQNDSMAIGALRLAREHGLRCPNDISVVGYNDVPLTAHLTPSLTTIKLPAYDLGQLSAELVVSLIEQPDQPSRRVMLDPELIVRESTTAR